ncbi:hypothetical protein ACEWY4_021507 [Coilia grayii]|uniref:ribonuclease H n=1 Tax=Coilia grayii TaxID=363190 RepID=A0ABD1J986_9TELE
MGEGPAPPTNIVNYVLKMRDKLEELSSLAHENKEQAQSSQKTWYDRTARSRSFNPGQKVLLLLPSSDSSLLAKWQGPYEVLRKMGPVTYEVVMLDRRRPKQVFHVNLLKEWISRPGSGTDMMWARAVAEEEELSEQYFPTAGGGATCPPMDHLTSCHQEELQQLIPEAAATFQRLMDQVLRGAESYAAAYIDDVVVYSTSWADHLKHLADVFQRIKAAGLVVNASKCQLARPEVCYLGYILGGGTIKPQVSKVTRLAGASPLRPHGGRYELLTCHPLPNFSCSVLSLSL